MIRVSSTRGAVRCGRDQGWLPVRWSARNCRLRRERPRTRSDP